MLLISTEQILSLKATQMIPLKCDYCQQNFERMQKYIKSDLKLRSYKGHFCSNACSILFAHLLALRLIIIPIKLMDAEDLN